MLYSSETAEDKFEMSHVRVRRTYRENVSKKLLIPSCNLHLKEPVGQGMHEQSHFV
jgi:hypothetical protein